MDGIIYRAVNTVHGALQWRGASRLYVQEIKCSASVIFKHMKCYSLRSATGGSAAHTHTRARGRSQVDYKFSAGVAV